jgi:hypothetical protein
VLGDTILELLGWSFHLIQNTDELDIKTRTKVRHLTKLGYNVVLVTSFVHIKERVVNTIEKARELAATTEGGVCLHIREHDIKRII